MRRLFIQARDAIAEAFFPDFYTDALDRSPHLAEEAASLPEDWIGIIADNNGSIE